jgi:hypothetical protein
MWWSHGDITTLTVCESAGRLPDDPAEGSGAVLDEATTLRHRNYIS